jgi:hypothetical protein
LEEKDARLILIAVTHMKQAVYSNFFKLRIISTFKSKKVENKWLLASSSTLTPAAVNVLARSKNCLRPIAFFGILSIIALSGTNRSR